ncbi:MAG: guanine deaminase [Pseudomonadota bacterium]
MTKRFVLLGQTLGYVADPFHVPAAEAARHDTHGAVVVEDGRIVDVGPAGAITRAYPETPPFDYGDALITAGFVDAHAHYPQTRMIASWGKRLIDWLNHYTFPEELKFADAAYARETAELYLDLLLAHGTTSVASFCTVHPESVTAFFEAAQARDMRVVAGKTCMDRHAPEGLTDSAQLGYDESKVLLERWHGAGRLIYAITPRFSPTSTAEQLEALGALWAEYPDCPMQTHLSEQPDEVAWVSELFPHTEDYLHSYEVHGLLGPGAMFGHGIHLTDRERDAIRDHDAGLIHCPTSNTFIGSGLFSTKDLADEKHRIGLATDTGGGSSFSMLRTMASAYELGQLRGTPLHPSQLYWLATQGSARTLRAEHQIGNLAPGMEADLVVLDLASTPAIAQRAARADDIWEALFPTIMMGDDRAVKATWVAGKPVKLSIGM